MKAPTFTLPTTDGTFKLSNFKDHWVVLYFYPKDDTPGCTLEGKDFTENIGLFKKLNAVVVGVSPDSVKKHCSFATKYGLKVILASDEAHGVLEKYGVWGKKKFMGREYTGVTRTTILIDPKGNIAQRWDNVKVSGHVKEVLKVLQEKQA